MTKTHLQHPLVEGKLGILGTIVQKWSIHVTINSYVYFGVPQMIAVGFAGPIRRVGCLRSVMFSKIRRLFSRPRTGANLTAVQI